MTTTKYTMEAYALIPEVESALRSNDSSVIVRESDSPRALQLSLYRQLVKNGIKERVVIAVDGNMVFVRIKGKSRIDVLTELCHKLMLHVDDERVYEQAMKILYGGQS